VHQHDVAGLQHRLRSGGTLEKRSGRAGGHHAHEYATIPVSWEIALVIYGRARHFSPHQVSSGAKKRSPDGYPPFSFKTLEGSVDVLCPLL